MALSILSRINDILQANIHDVLDRAEDPQKMGAQYLRKVDEAIAAAKEHAAGVIGETKLLEGDLKHERTQAAEWGRKAGLAVDRGDDDLARECLQRKRQYETNATTLEERLVTFRSSVATVKQMVLQLETRRAEIERQISMLVVRDRLSKAQEVVQKSVAATTGYDPTTTLARIEDRVRRREAKVEGREELAAGSLDSRLASLDAAHTDAEIEDELLHLKASRARHQLPPGRE